MRSEIQRSVRGLGLSLVNFRCDKKRVGLPPGSRVSFGWTVGEPPYQERVKYIGTVHRWRKKDEKVIVRRDFYEVKEGEPSEWLSLWQDQLDILGEKAIENCKYHDEPVYSDVGCLMCRVRAQSCEPSWL